MLGKPSPASREAERRCSVATSRSTPAARRRPAGSIAIRVIGAAPRSARRASLGLRGLRLGRGGRLARGLRLALALAALLDGQLLGVAHQRGGQCPQVGRDPRRTSPLGTGGGAGALGG